MKKKSENESDVRCCNSCQKEMTKTEIGACKKILGRSTDNWLCLPCLAKTLETTTDYIEEMIESWKERGCTLFS